MLTNEQSANNYLQPEFLEVFISKEGANNVLQVLLLWGFFDTQYYKV